MAVGIIWWGEALGQGFVNVCCLCSFLCLLAEAGWVSVAGRRKMTHKTEM